MNINWRLRMTPPRSGSIVRVTSVADGDWGDVSWNEGDELTLISDVHGEGTRKQWDTKNGEIYEGEFEVIKYAD